MADIPKFKTICDLLDDKPNTWERIKPLVEIALILSPGIIASSLGIAIETWEALGNGVTLTDVLEMVEAALFPEKGFWSKRNDHESPYDRPRLANALVIYAAWFDALENHASELWDNLELDEEGFSWLQQQGKAEYERVLAQLRSDGRAVFLPDSCGSQALEQLYTLLKDRTHKLARELVKTQNLRIEWDNLPGIAVEMCQRYSEILMKYPEYRHWDEYLDRNKGARKSKTKKLVLPLGEVLGKGRFHGREAELKALEEALDCGNPVKVTGLGGMGKTVLVKSFAYRYQSQKRGNVYFVTFQGDFYGTVIGAISGGVVGLPEKLPEAEVYRQTMQVLECCTSDDLLIIDNVDREDCTFQELLDETYDELCRLNLHLILTTRFREAGGIWIDTLPDDKLYKIFRVHDADLSLQQMDALIASVDGHTMTVDMIARAIGLSDDEDTPELILESMHSSTPPSPEVPEVGADSDRKQQRIYDRLKALFNLSGISAAGRQALSCATLLPQDGLDARMFSSSLDKSATDALYGLRERGWVRRENKCYYIHPLIRLVCRGELNPTDESCGTFLDSLWDQHDTTKFEYIRIRRLAMVFSEASSYLADREGKWAHKAGLLWYMVGEYSKSLGFDAFMVERMERCYGENSVELATAYNNLGATYESLGDYERALEYQQKALRIHESIMPPSYSDLVVGYNNVATIYKYLGKFVRARINLALAIAITEKHQLPDYPYLAICYSNMGSLLGQIGDYEYALEYKLKALVIQQRVLSPEHPDIARSYGNVAFSLAQLDRFVEAADLIGRTMNIQEQTLPENHPDRLATLKVAQLLVKCVVYQKLGMDFPNPFRKEE